MSNYFIPNMVIVNETSVDTDSVLNRNLFKIDNNISLFILLTFQVLWESDST